MHQIKQFLNPALNGFGAFVALTILLLIVAVIGTMVSERRQLGKDRSTRAAWIVSVGFLVVLVSVLMYLSS